MSESSWVEKANPDHPLIAAGLVGDGDMTFIDRIAILHLIRVLKNHYDRRLRPAVLDVFLSRGLEPRAAVLHPPVAGLGAGVAIVSRGMVRALAVISARIAITFERESQPFFFLRREKIGQTVRRLSPDSLQGFDFSPEVMRYCGFDNASLGGLASELAGDTLLVFIEVLCASLEFVVLHEAGHVVFRHREAGEIFRLEQSLMSGFHKLGLVNWDGNSPDNYFQPELRIARCFEHQADYFALRLMVTSPPYRPDMPRFDGKVWVGSVFTEKTTRRLLAFLGASVSFAVVALLESPEPSALGDISLRKRSYGIHPLPSVRLTVANMMLTSELMSWWRRLFMWPGLLFDSRYRERLAIVDFICTFVCMGVVRQNWRTALAEPAAGNPAWSGRLLDQHSNIQASLGISFDDDYRQASELVNRVRKQLP